MYLAGIRGEVSVAEGCSSVFHASLFDLLSHLRLLLLIHLHRIKLGDEVLFNHGPCLEVYLVHLDIEMGINRLMIRDGQLSSVVLGESHRGCLLREDDAIGPGRRPVLRGLVVIGTWIELVGGQESDLALLAVLEDVVLHTVHVELVFAEEGTYVLLFDSVHDWQAAHIDAEVKVSEVHLHIMLPYLVAFVLRPSLAFVCLAVQKRNLLLTLLHVPWKRSTSQVAVQKDECGVFEAKPHRDGALVTRPIPSWRLHVAHSDIEDASLYLSLRDQQDE